MNKKASCNIGNMYFNQKSPVPRNKVSVTYKGAATAGQYFLCLIWD